MNLPDLFIEYWPLSIYAASIVLTTLLLIAIAQVIA